MWLDCGLIEHSLWSAFTNLCMWHVHFNRFLFAILSIPPPPQTSVLVSAPLSDSFERRHWFSFGWDEIVSGTKVGLKRQDFVTQPVFLCRNPSKRSILAKSVVSSPDAAISSENDVIHVLTPLRHLTPLYSLLPLPWYLPRPHGWRDPETISNYHNPGSSWSPGTTVEARLVPDTGTQQSDKSGEFLKLYHPDHHSPDTHHPRPTNSL